MSTLSDDGRPVDWLERLPHKPPMRLLSRVIEVACDRASAEVTIGPDAAFRSTDGSVPAWVALEYLGQTAALIGIAQALAALPNADATADSRAPRDGFLLGARRLDLCARAFRPGETLTVQCRAVGEVGDALASFEGEVRDASGAALVGGVLSVVNRERPTP